QYFPNSSNFIINYLFGVSYWPPLHRMYSIDDLNLKLLSELKQIAETFGINYKGLSKKEIALKILEKQNEGENGKEPATAETTKAVEQEPKSQEEALQQNAGTPSKGNEEPVAKRKRTIITKAASSSTTSTPSAKTNDEPTTSEKPAK